MGDEGSTGERWAEARRLFLEVVDLEDPVRGERMDAIAAEDPELGAWVRRLVAADILDEAEEAQTALAGQVVPKGRRSPNRRIGPYEVLRPIATGGMGEVLLARRIDGEFEREVAIKLIKSGVGGEELLQRFLRERQTLAELDHEYVARLLDGGTTQDGQPYLIMEYIEGEPLDVYCRERDLGLHARIKLFRGVCAAVQHAHERGVIHRDLKPGNILVRRDGTPRLLDFGIAHLGRQDTPGDLALTRTGHRLFTPEYASPEQVLGKKISEATDVFALGVLLYGLVADRSPWPLESLEGIHELERTICEVTPPPPSRHRQGTSRRKLSGDLDTIVLKCLAQDPTDRYATVERLSQDLERFLDGRPILARRRSAIVAMWRRLRRHPWSVASVVALVALAVVVYRVRSKNEEQIDQLIDATQGQIEAARNLREQGRADLAEIELRAALEALDQFDGQEFLRGEVLRQLAVTANHQRRFLDAIEYVARARSVITDRDGRAILQLASLNNAEAYALLRSGRFEEGWRATESALAFAQEHLELGHELRIDALLELSDQHRKRGEVESAIELVIEAVDEAKARPDPRDETLGRSIFLWGHALHGQGHVLEAVMKYRESLEVLTWQFADRHPSVAEVRCQLGRALLDLSELDEAHEQLHRAVNAFLALGSKREAAVCFELLGGVSMAAGQAPVAVRHFEDSLELREEVYRRTHRVVRMTRFLWATALIDSGEIEQGRAALEDSLANPLGLDSLDAGATERARGLLRELDGFD